MRRKYHWQSISVRDLDIRQDFTVRPLDRAESLCRLGELRLLWGDEHVAEADGYFDEALSLAPNGARALTGKATVRLGLGEPEEAIALLERAIHLEPSAHSYYLLGNALMQRFAAELRRGPARGEPTPPLVARAREAYQKALQLEPRLLDAYDQVARTYVYDSESQQSGVELMEKVLARVPRVDLALTLIELHSRRGDREAARAVKDAHLARLVDAMSHRSVDAWGEEGRPRHALALARELEDKTDDGELRREIEKRILSLSP